MHEATEVMPGNAAWLPGEFLREYALLPLAKGSIMALMGFSETIFLFLLALLIFGPKKLPEIARQVGKALNEFKRASNEFKAQINAEISQLEREEARQTILPPAERPTGSVASSEPAEALHALPPPDLTSHPEEHSAIKAAPDA